MLPERIADLLQPYLDVPAPVQAISTYIDILIRWNARLNLTAVRQPEEIVTRHFGESLVAARHLFPEKEATPAARLVDVGSGAGFPGLPIKLWAPAIHLTLIESNQKKATFLREVVRALTLTNVDVFAGRAADYHASLTTTAPVAAKTADVVTLRAVERFDAILPEAADLLAPSGRLAILIGQAQIDPARRLVPSIDWGPPVKIPQSSNRFLLLGRYESK
jgi:16S rRNA (guanine527-N7)-methyltransferase